MPLLLLLLLLLLQVRAVVLRINSPGGSAVASDMIAREIKLLREAGKPVR
jgi:protease-4